MTDSEREDLDNLVKSPGWLRVTHWATEEWAQQIGRHVEIAADDRDDQAALNKLRQVIAAKKAVEVVLQWPESRLKELLARAAQAERIPTMARGGL